MLAKRVYLAVGILLALLFASVGAWRWHVAHEKPAVVYRTAPLEKRNITAKVTASGTLSATITVQVGAQVSGRIAKLNADFNTPVKKGELIAELDPSLFQAAVEQAQASYDQALAALTKSRSGADLAEKQRARTTLLHQQGLAAQQDLDTAESAAQTAKADVQLQNANVEQARAQLNQARVNLSYTKIYSPIDGVVISRNVDVGQTVAASLQAPVLFTIAEDLRKMQVDTNVSEGDVGRLKEGMKAFFTVDAFPGQRFHGVISQIRNAATNVQNVVTYDAVIKVDNDELELRPGMTANVTIIYAQRKDAVAVPNAALRFHPPEAQAEAHHHKRGEEEARTVYVVQGVAAKPAKVETGLTDGLYTEVTGGEAHDGDAVAIDTIGGAAKSSSPLGGGGHGGRMF